MAYRKISIVIPRVRDVVHLKRCLWSIAVRKPVWSRPHVLLADENGVAEGALRKFSSVFDWTYFGKFDQELLSCITEKDEVFLMDSSTIAWEGAFDSLIQARPDHNVDRKDAHFIVASSTYELWAPITEKLDDYGANLHQGMVDYCEQFVLQNEHLHSDKLDFLSLSSIRGVEWLYGKTDDAISITRTNKAVSLFQCPKESLSQERQASSVES